MTDFEKKALPTVNDAMHYAMEYNLYPELQHKAFASVYADGEKAYYEHEIMQLIKEAPNKSLIANSWINSGMPDVNCGIITSSILERCECVDKKNPGHLPKYQNSSEEEKLKTIKDWTITFWRIYYAYKKLRKASISVCTQMKYSLSPSAITDIYECCNPDIIGCNYLTFCNAIFNPDTFCNIAGTKSNLMLFVNLLSKFRALGTEWKKEVCLSKGWDISECSKRSPKADANTPEWYEKLQRMVE